MEPDKKTNILLVDDTPAKLLALESALLTLNQNLVTASSGKEALRALLTQDFAVILLDVRMPEMDGFETAALIRQRQRSAQTPIIFETAFERGEIAEVRGYSLGAVDYIYAPIVPEILRAKVAVFVELNRQTEALRESDQRLRATFDQAAVGIAHTGLDGRWLLVNRGFCEIVGHTREKLLGRLCRDLTHLDDLEMSLENRRRVLAGETETCSTEMRYVRADGSYVWVREITRMLGGVEQTTRAGLRTHWKARMFHRATQAARKYGSISPFHFLGPNKAEEMTIVSMGESEELVRAMREVTDGMLSVGGGEKRIK